MRRSSDYAKSITFGKVYELGAMVIHFECTQVNGCVIRNLLDLLHMVADVKTTSQQ